MPEYIEAFNTIFGIRTGEDAPLSPTHFRKNVRTQDFDQWKAYVKNHSSIMPSKVKKTLYLIRPPTPRRLPSANSTNPNDINHEDKDFGTLLLYLYLVESYLEAYFYGLNVKLLDL